MPKHNRGIRVAPVELRWNIEGDGELVGTTGTRKYKAWLHISKLYDSGCIVCGTMPARFDLDAGDAHARNNRVLSNLESAAPFGQFSVESFQRADVRGPLPDN